MRRLEVSPTKFSGVLVPGGWKASVPTITIRRDDERFRGIVASFMRLGASQAQAEEIAIEACQGVFDGRWLELLKKFVGRWAKIYEESYGDLEGFDPERLEGLFLPGRDDLFGQRRNTEVRREFTRMREETQTP